MALINCPECNKEIPEGAIRCEYCKGTVRKAVVICKNCNTENSSSAFCKKCGTRLIKPKHSDKSYADISGRTIGNPFATGVRILSIIAAFCCFLCSFFLWSEEIIPGILVWAVLFISIFIAVIACALAEGLNDIAIIRDSVTKKNKE